MFKIANALGLDESHVTNVDFGGVAAVPAHAYLQAPLSELAAAARQAGFTLGVASAFRSFERQRNIWNGKVSGERPVLSVNEEPLDIGQLTRSDLLVAIMHWSAVPGGSRHHWGTDIDIYDASALKNQKLGLTKTEAETLFAPFYLWLEDYLAANPHWQRPYNGKGPVAEEPWHLSFSPLALEYQKLISPDTVLAQIKKSNVLLAEVIEPVWAERYATYIANYFVCDV